MASRKVRKAAQTAVMVPARLELAKLSNSTKKNRYYKRPRKRLLIKSSKAEVYSSSSTFIADSLVIKGSTTLTVKLGVVT